MTCPDVSNNSDLTAGKPRGSAVLKTLIDSINSTIQMDLVDPACDIEKQSSILTATGIWLDHIGERLIYPRPLIAASDFLWFGFDGNGFGFDQANFTPGGTNKVGIDDESYRALLIVRGGQLLTDCSIPSLDAILKGAFGNGHYIDNGDMTVDVIIDNSLDDIIIITTVESGLITKPAGVKIRNILVSDLAGNFGFDGNGVGFDQAVFVRTYQDLLDHVSTLCDPPIGYSRLTSDGGDITSGGSIVTSDGCPLYAIG